MDGDLPLICGDEPYKDRDECGFSRSVATEQGMDPTWLQTEGHPL